MQIAISNELGPQKASNVWYSAMQDMIIDIVVKIQICYSPLIKREDECRRQRVDMLFVIDKMR